MKTRYFNAKILPIENDLNIIEGELHTENGKITYIGKTNNNDKSFDNEVDMKNNLIMPGLKNAHTHTPMVMLRSYGGGLPLDRWLFEKIFPMEAKFSADDVELFTKIGLLEYIKTGTTACFDMYFHKNASAKAAGDFGFRYVLCGAVDGGKERIEQLKDEYDTYSKYNEFVSYNLGFHSEYLVKKELLEEISKYANEMKLPVYMHCEETKKETDECIERHGMTPIMLFNKLGIFEHGGGVFHGVHANDDDIKIMKEKEVFMITNPCSNVKLASGIAPLEKMRTMGVNLAIGTDGASSNNEIGLWREMYLASTLQKIRENNASAMPAADTLLMATKGSARAMRLNDSDCLAVGKNADFIGIDTNAINMFPENDIIEDLVYSAGNENVMMTVINGKMLYKDGEFFVSDDVEYLLKEGKKAAERLKNF